LKWCANLEENGSKTTSEVAVSTCSKESPVTVISPRQALEQNYKKAQLAKRTKYFDQIEITEEMKVTKPPKDFLKLKE